MKRAVITGPTGSIGLALINEPRAVKESYQ